MQSEQGSYQGGHPTGRELCLRRRRASEAVELCRLHQRLAQPAGQHEDLRFHLYEHFAAPSELRRGHRLKSRRAARRARRPASGLWTPLREKEGRAASWTPPREKGRRALSREQGERRAARWTPPREKGRRAFFRDQGERRAAHSRKENMQRTPPREKRGRAPSREQGGRRTQSESPNNTRQPTDRHIYVYMDV